MLQMNDHGHVYSVKHVAQELPTVPTLLLSLL